MAVAKEYRGQPIIAQLSARLEPPDNEHDNCECMLVMTNQHLYILEDSYEGDYITHYEFVLGEIDNLLISGEERGVRKLRGVITALLNAVGESKLSVLEEEKGSVSGSDWKRFEIHYHTVEGDHRWLYFTEYDVRARKFVKAFNELKTGRS